MLEIEQLEAAYGDLQVVWDVSLTVPEGSIVALVGSNGAGKTTTLRAVMGLMPVKSGKVVYKGDSIVGVSTHQITRSGLVMIPEERAVFPSLTVADNLAIGGDIDRGDRPDSDVVAEVYDMFPRLAERQTQKAGTLSGGERQMLAIGKALMAQPEMLILDEPSLGLAPIVVEHTFEAIGSIRDRGLSVLVVEQHVQLALEVADHAYVIELGRVVADGPAEAMLDDPAVRDAYLGL